MKSYSRILVTGRLKMMLKRNNVEENHEGRHDK